MNLRPLAILAALALGLPACSGDDGDTGASTTNATNTTNTTNTTTASTSTSGSTSETSGGSGSGSAGSTSGSTTGDPSTSGSTTDAPTTGTSTGGTTGGATDPYDPATCDGDPLGVGGIEGAFCSPTCTMSSDCPAGPMGTQAQCVLTTMMGQPPTNCALICQVDNDMCPEGSTCKDLMMMGAGICTYP